MGLFRASQVRKIDVAFEDLGKASKGRDHREAAGDPAVRRAEAVLKRVVENSTSAERGAWASDANDRLFGT